MGCTSCSSGGAPAGCNSNGSCMTDGGCGKMDVFDWLSDIDSPNAGTPFNIVEVRFKGSRKEFYHNENNIYVESGNLVAVEGPLGGYDIGHVTLTGELVRLQLSKNNISPDSEEVRKLYRLAHEKDVEKWKEVKAEETNVMHRARFHANTLGLQMKISDVEIQGDRKKGTFFYTADSRVDFRELLKLLADEFRFRIEMRQIGMRQEAGRLGGIGSCGRELCCTTWLTNFKTVSTSAARYQNLAINTQKLAGQCGKLKCCLNFELDTYLDALKSIPKGLNKLELAGGTAMLQKTDIFKKTMWFSLEKGGAMHPISVDRVNEIVGLNKKGEKPEFLGLPELVIPDDKPSEFVDVIGEDSLTRLDNKNKKPKNKRKKSRKPQRKKPTNDNAKT